MNPLPTPITFRCAKLESNPYPNSPALYLAKNYFPDGSSHLHFIFGNNPETLSSENLVDIVNTINSHPDWTGPSLVLDLTNPDNPSCHLSDQSGFTEPLIWKICRIYNQAKGLSAL